MTTSKIWSDTHKALVRGEWSRARPLLETLSRSDVRDYLSAPAVYGAPTFIADRIDAVNAQVDRNTGS